MKSTAFLIFNKIGEITQRCTRSDTFGVANFPEFDHYKKYKDYIILYNVEPNNRNLTVFPFTDDIYTSDIALLKVENNYIKNLTYKMYIKQLLKIKQEPNDYYPDSDSEIEDINPFTY